MTTSFLLGMAGGCLTTAALTVCAAPAYSHNIRKVFAARLIRDLTHYRENYWNLYVLDSGVPRLVIQECLDIIRWHGTGEARYVVPHGICRTPGSPRRKTHKVD